MHRGPKPAKVQSKVKPIGKPKAQKNEGSRGRDLEQRLAEALAQVTRDRAQMKRVQIANLG
jgi:hypothetical protein